MNTTPSVSAASSISPTTDPSAPPIDAPDVAAVFASYDPAISKELMVLRELILSTAAETDGVSRIDETLKWGQPSYLTGETRSGSTIRIAPAAADSSFDYAMYFICHTNLVESFKDLFGEVLDYDGKRALLFSAGAPLRVSEVRECVALALTYHR